MNFAPTEDRRMLADTLGRFVREQYAFDARDRIAKSPQGYSPQAWRQFAELGVIAALHGEAEGGFGGTGFDIAVVFEQLGRGLVVEPLLASAVLAGSAIAAAGNAGQRQLLASIIDGTRIAAFAHAEPDSRYELARRTRAPSAGAGLGARGRQGGGAARRGSRRVRRERADLRQRGRRGRHLAVPGGRRGRRDLAARLPAHRWRSRGRAASRGRARGRRCPAGPGRCRPRGARGRGRQGHPRLCAESPGAMHEPAEATLEYLRTAGSLACRSAIPGAAAPHGRCCSEIEQARSAVINAAAALEGDRLAASAPCRPPSTRSDESERWWPRSILCARRHRHDLGTAARALCEATRDDRPSAGDEDHHLERHVARQRKPP